MRLRLALVSCVALAACSNGSSGKTHTVPTLPWGSFRHDANNSGSGGGINQNKGNVTLTSWSTVSTVPEISATISTPVIDNESNVFIGTSDGVVSFDKSGKLRWYVNECAATTPPSRGIPGTPGPSVLIGSVSSSVTVQGGGSVVFGAEPNGRGGVGGLFFLQEKHNQVSCVWVVPETGDVGEMSGIRSSPQTQVYALDLSLQTIYVGGQEGYLRTINGNGTRRWQFPALQPFGGALTSTPAVGSNGSIYVTTPEGFLQGVDSSGKALWPPVAIGIPPEAPLQQSPAVNTTIYAIGAESALFGINQDATLKFVYPPNAPVLGSPSFLAQTVDTGSLSIADTVIYMVDQEGVLYGVSDTSGQIVNIQRCTNDVGLSCRTDSCPSGQTCKNNKCQSDSGGSSSGIDCTPDSCVAAADNKGTCEVFTTGVQPITSSGSITVETSPAVSGDLFAVVGTTDGRVCARALDTTVPGIDKPGDTDQNDPWFTGDGCIQLPDDGPILSSPAIGTSGRIYVTTASGIYVIQ